MGRHPGRLCRSARRRTVRAEAQRGSRLDPQDRPSCDDPPVAWTVTLRPQLNKNRARARETLKKPLWLADLNGSIDSLGDGPCIGIVVRAQFHPLLSLF